MVGEWVLPDLKYYVMFVKAWILIPIAKNQEFPPPHNARGEYARGAHPRKPECVLAER